MPVCHRRARAFAFGVVTRPQLSPRTLPGPYKHLTCALLGSVTIKMGALSTKKAPPPPPPNTPLTRATKWFDNYISKFKGAKGSAPPRADWTNTAWTFLGVFLGMFGRIIPRVFHFLPTSIPVCLLLLRPCTTRAAVLVDEPFRLTRAEFAAVPSLINSQVLAANKSEYILMMGSFGALATLLYAAPASPFAQVPCASLPLSLAALRSCPCPFFRMPSSHAALSPTTMLRSFGTSTVYLPNPLEFSAWPHH